MIANENTVWIINRSIVHTTFQRRFARSETRDFFRFKSKEPGCGGSIVIIIIITIIVRRSPTTKVYVSARELLARLVIIHSDRTLGKPSDTKLVSERFKRIVAYYTWPNNFVENRP